VQECWSDEAPDKCSFRPAANPRHVRPIRLKEADSGEITGHPVPRDLPLFLLFINQYRVK
jgi:hypothetical protein